MTADTFWTNRNQRKDYTMPKYRVEVGYKTKRESVCAGMEVEAFDQDEAEEIARAKIIDPYPARKWAFTRVSEERSGFGVFAEMVIPPTNDGGGHVNREGKPLPYPPARMGGGGSAVDE